MEGAPISLEDLVGDVRNASSLLKSGKRDEAADFLWKSELVATDEFVKSLLRWASSHISEGPNAQSVPPATSVSETMKNAIVSAVLSALSVEDNVSTIVLVVKTAVDLKHSGSSHRPEIIHSIVKELGKGHFLVVDGDQINLAQLGKAQLDALRSDVSELTDEEDEVLRALEAIESKLVESGIYETDVTLSTVSDAVIGLDEDGVRHSLDSLAKKRFLIEFDSDHYRSRTSEMVRLLYLVRQRFSPGKRASRPRLVRSVKFRTIPRVIPEYIVPLPELLDQLDRVIKNSAAWPTYQSVWVSAQDILRKFLEQVRLVKLARFQARATVSIFDDLLRLETKTADYQKLGRVISAGTGTGKTEAFLIPHLLLLILRKLKGLEPESLLFCIYPRVRLAVNQIQRFLRYVMVLNALLPSPITVGMVEHEVPASWEDLVNQREFTRRTQGGALALTLFACPNLNFNSDLGLQKECQQPIVVPDSPGPLKCTAGHAIPYIPTRRELATEEPDILVITPESLHRFVMQSSYNGMFKGYVKTFVIDEIHLYEGIHGSQMGMLIRRVCKKCTELESSVMLVGSSATMAVPTDFFRELTSVGISEDRLISPLEEDLVESGTEIFLFVKPETVALVEVETDDSSVYEYEERRVSPFSTLIQTMMCVMHNARRRPEKYKAMAFIDSVDSAYSWKQKQADSESARYQPRLPMIRIDPDFTKEGITDCVCSTTAPNADCSLYREGELWWFPRFDADQYKGRDPLSFAQVTSVEKIDFDENWDVVISTSSLEVGFDDPRIMAIFQYKAPHSVSSFLQRKGRGARKPDDRPITVVVLNPYSPKDLFYFRHPEELLEADIAETPINAENYHVQRAHFNAALMDAIATKLSRDFYMIPSTDALERLENTLRQSEELLSKWTENLFPGDIYRRYAFRPFSRTVDGLIDSIRFGLRQKRIHTVVDLSDYIPKNMFEGLNVPNVTVGLDQQARDIAEALKILVPGNPTNRFRVGDRKAWCPIQKLEHLGSVTWIPREYCRDQPLTEFSRNELPEYLRPLLTHNHRTPVLRPRHIIIDAFDGSQFCPQCNQVLGPGANHPHKTRLIEPTSKCYPITYSRIETLSKGKSYHELKQGKFISLLGLQGLIDDFRFFFEYHSGLRVIESFLGSQIQLKTGMGRTEPPAIETFSVPGGDQVAYGYDIDTEGFSITIGSNVAHLELPTDLKRELQQQQFNYGLTKAALADHEFNMYTASHIASIIGSISPFRLELVEELSSLSKMDPLEITKKTEDYRERLSSDISALWPEAQSWEDLTEALAYVRARFYVQMPNINWEDSVAALTSKRIASIVAEQLDRTGKSELFEQFCQDVLVHSVKHTFQRAAAIVGGVKEEDLKGVFYPISEFGKTTNPVQNRTLYIFERQQGGNGATRTIQNRVLNSPGFYRKKDLISLAEDFSVNCPTGDVEDIINQGFFKIDADTLRGLREKISRAKSGDLLGLRHELSKIFGIYPSTDLISKIVEIVADKSINGNEIDDFLLHKEVWVTSKLCERQLGRIPTIQEIKGTIFWLIGKDVYINRDFSEIWHTQKNGMERFTFSELSALHQALGDDDEGEKVFWEEVEKRILLSCTSVCPECLGSSCSSMHIYLSDYLLSRHLLKLTVLKSRRKFTVEASDEGFERNLSSLIENNHFAYVRFNSANSSQVMHATSRILSQAGFRVPFIRDARPVVSEGRIFEELLLQET